MSLGRSANHQVELAEALKVGDQVDLDQALRDAGGQKRQDPSDVGGSELITSVKDADGSVIGLVQSP